MAEVGGSRRLRRQVVGLRRRIDETTARRSAAARALPDFLIIGAQKSGTSSLFRWLRQHPQVVTTGRENETHYFTRNHERGEDWYRSHFPRRAELDAADGTRRITGEKTPLYLHDPDVPARAAALVPDARLVAVLREPTARAVSHYRMTLAKGYERLDAAAAIDAEPERLAAAAAKGPEALRAAYRFAYVGRGRYAEQLDRWLAEYPASQLLVLRAEDLWREPQAGFDRVTAFLDLDRFEPDFVHANRAKRGVVVPAGVRARLDAAFVEPNRDLAERHGIAWP